MPERPGGFERRDIDEGFHVLALGQSLDELRRNIDIMPVLRSPIFHAQLRQYRLQTTKEFEQHPEAYRNFMGVYDAFFTELHNRAYFAQPETQPSTDRAAADEPWSPAFFVEVQRLLDASIPAPDGPTYNPGTDSAKIAVEIARLTSGKAVDLSAWVPTPGTRWSAVVVACRHCHELRLVVRPYLLDLEKAPEILDHLRKRRIAFAPCLACGSQRVIPVRVWIAEDPAPGDPLSAVSALCRVHASETIFLPPPGTVRNPDYDRILEVRLEMLMQRLKLDPPSDGRNAPGVYTNGVAYSLDELLWRIDQVAAKPPAAVAYEDIVSDVSRKVASQILGWPEAEQQIRKIVFGVGREWPLMQAHPAGDLIQALVRNLICEAAAEARSLSLEVRAHSACLVAQCYAGLGETSLARGALTRGRDLVAQLSDGSRRAALDVVLDNVEADILSAEGDHEAASRIRRRVLSSGQGTHSTSPSARLSHEQNLQNRAFDLRYAGHLAEAIQAMREGLKAFEQLASADEPDVQTAARLGLSGTLANLAATYIDCAQNLDLLAAVTAPGFKFETLSRVVKERFLHLGSAQALLSMQDEMTKRALPLLDEEASGPVTSQELAGRAEQLLRKALSIAKDVGDFEYLSIQSHTLALLLQYTGRGPEFETAEQDSLSYAARIGQYQRIAKAASFLASAALDRGDGPAAIARVEQCLRAEMRDLVRTGARSESRPELIAAIALRATQAGGDPLSAMLIAESSKAIPLTVSLMRGVPTQAPAGPSTLLTKLLQLSSQRETLRLRSIWQSSPGLASEIASVTSDMDTARQELALRDPRSAIWHDATYLDLSDARAVRRILKQMGPRTTYAGFFIDRDMLYAYAIWAEDQLIACSRSPADSVSKRDWPAVAASILEPLAPRLSNLHRDDRLLVSLCPGIETVPLALLPCGGATLCERVTLSIVRGSGMLEACAARPQHPIHKAVAIGAPARLDLPELPNAAVEVENIAVELEAAGISVRPTLTGNFATVPALLASVPGANLLHFACHAAPPEDGAEAQLMLSPSPLAKDSGVLTEDRILSEMSLLPGCHINLAGCRTAIPGAEGRYFTQGLISTFLVAGASSVLATLWPLADAPAAVFQSAYYGNLTRGLSPAFALAATQRSALRGELGEALGFPEHFAGYCLNGIG